MSGHPKEEAVYSEPPLDAEAIGGRLGDARKAQHLTQEQVGAAVGCSPSYLSQLECGRRLPSLYLFCLLVVHLNTDAHMILFGERRRRHTVVDDLSADQLDGLAKLLSVSSRTQR